LDIKQKSLVSHNLSSSPPPLPRPNDPTTPTHSHALTPEHVLHGRTFLRRAADLTAAHHWNPHNTRGFRTSLLSSATSTIAVPEMGDSITEGSIAAVLKAAGDTVAVDEVIAQIETDKVGRCWLTQ